MLKDFFLIIFSMKIFVILKKISYKFYWYVDWNFVFLDCTLVWVTLDTIINRLGYFNI